MFSSCRLTFWLSNSVMLRAIVSQVFQKFQPSTIDDNDQEGVEESSVPKRQECSSNKKIKDNIIEDSEDWEDPQTFITALEKFEAWTFSRIVESVWWQVISFFFLCYYLFPVSFMFYKF